MCGIAGALVLPRGAPLDRDELVRMSDAIAHRGPDGDGWWLAEDSRVGFAHRRLAIIDPTPEADQPMENHDRSVILVFNGEIYNHAEIRRELEGLGVAGWTTDHSDTEVVLKSYERWGIACLDRLRGMFAIALWDARDRALWLVRDRIGVKPLYVTQRDGRVVFASEIKALLREPTQRRAVNEQALFHYLSFLTTPAPDTMFEGIEKLPAGTWMRLTLDGGRTVRTWWDAWDHVSPSGLVGAAAEEMVRERLRESVALRKVADVPVGVFLSGGIDSSVNAVLFAEGEHRPVKTFSIGYAGENSLYPSELGHARTMASVVGADHHELLLTADDAIDLLPEMIALQDEPIADPVCVPIHYLSALARSSGVVVAQVGEGADELFAGYPNWLSMLRLQERADRVGLLPVKRAVSAVARRGHVGGFRTEWISRMSRGQPVFWSGAESFAEHDKRRLLSPRLRGSFSALSSWDAIAPIRATFLDRAWEPSAMHWMTYVDLRLRLPELLLMRVDKMSMGVGLECRVPFLDHLLVEDCLSMSADAKLGPGQPKHLLKQAVSGLLPAEIMSRPKQGFGLPIDDFFAQGLRRIAVSAVDHLTASTDLLDRTEAMRVVSRGSAWHSWYLMNLALWWKAYIA